MQLTCSFLQVIQGLRRLSLSATLSCSRQVVIEAEPAVIDELHRYGFGTEARRKQSKRSKPVPDPCTELRHAPIILEEAFFLQHTIRCLQVRITPQPSCATLETAVLIKAGLLRLQLINRCQTYSVQTPTSQTTTADPQGRPISEKPELPHQRLCSLPRACMLGWSSRKAFICLTPRN